MPMGCIECGAWGRPDGEPPMSWVCPACRERDRRFALIRRQLFELQASYDKMCGQARLLTRYPSGNGRYWRPSDEPARLAAVELQERKLSEARGWYVEKRAEIVALARELGVPLKESHA